MLRIIAFLLGVYLLSIGVLFTIVYLNLLTMGYSIKEYILFIITRYEVLTSLIGILLITLAMKKGIKRKRK